MSPIALREVIAIRPYYERAGVELYFGDCRDVLPMLGKDTADLIVTDPPYGLAYESNRRTATESMGAIAGDDDAGFVADALSSACRVLRRGRHAYVFGPREVIQAPLTAAVDLIWDKGIIGTGDLSSPWATQHELITFAVYELSEANRRKGYGNAAARLRAGSILSYQRKQSGQVKRHPTEKPVPLLRRLIESSSLFGETVLDPFIGSGSTAVAAVLEGRGCIGIESDEAYVMTAAERCERVLDWLDTRGDF